MLAGEGYSGWRASPDEYRHVTGAETRARERQKVSAWVASLVSQRMAVEGGEKRERLCLAHFCHMAEKLVLYWQPTQTPSGPHPYSPSLR